MKVLNLGGGWAQPTPPTHIMDFFHVYKSDSHETLQECCGDPLQISQSVSTSEPLENWVLDVSQNNKSRKILLFLLFLRGRNFVILDE